MKPPTQRDRVLAIIRNAGKLGVRSDRFLASDVRIPRAAARVEELIRLDGHDIRSTREGHFCRYTYFPPQDTGVGGGSADTERNGVVGRNTVVGAPDPGVSIVGGGGGAGLSGGPPGGAAVSPGDQPESILPGSQASHLHLPPAGQGPSAPGVNLSASGALSLFELPKPPVAYDPWEAAA